jgi:hypothetical protein
MGYGFGVWFVYDKDLFETEHIGHITIACFMQKEDAISLKNELNSKITELLLTSDGSHILFDKNLYKHDKNNICSWGFEFYSKKWSFIKKICNDYICSFSETPHTSIEYGKFNDNFNIYDIEPVCLDGTIEVVDIRSDFPVDWKIIK